MKRVVEIDDTLDECVQEAIDAIKEELENYLKENKPSSCPDFSDLDGRGTLTEHIDSAIPVYTKELSDNYYFHQDVLDQALDNSGLDYESDADRRMSLAHYAYISQECYQWWHDEAETIYDEWVASGQNDFDIGDRVTVDEDEGSGAVYTITGFEDGKVILDNGEGYDYLDLAEASEDD